MTSATLPPPRRRTRHRPLAAVVRAVTCAAALVATGLVAGCDLRLETPDPPVLVPDDAEVLRDRNAQDAAALAAAAQAASATAEEGVAAALTLVATASTEHVAALGGVYDPFPGAAPTAAATASATPTPSPEPPTAAAVLEQLRTAADAARADATTVAVPAMAHLLTAITLNRLLLADALTAAIDGTTPELGTVTVPETLPIGLAPQTAVVLVQSEDAAGMAWEVVAARSADDARARAAARAALHRERAQAWADAAGIAGTGTDPRRSAYDLPETVTDSAAPSELMWTALGEIEQTLGETYAALVPTVAPAERAALLDTALEALRRAASLNVPVAVLPGMAETAA